LKATLQDKKWQLLSIILATALATSLGFNIYQAFEASKNRFFFVNTDYTAFSNSTIPSSASATCSGKTVNFTWTGKYHMVPDGKLTVNVTFDWSTDELKATIKVNDNDTSAFDSVHLAFGENGNFPKPGIGTKGYALYTINKTLSYSYSQLSIVGYIIPSICQDLIIKSPYHTCHYEDGVYTFNFHIPKTSVDFPLRIHLGWYDDVPYYCRVYDSFVYVQFGM
jgi:hypothetical protein